MLSTSLLLQPYLRTACSPGPNCAILVILRANTPGNRPSFGPRASRLPRSAGTSCGGPGGYARQLPERRSCAAFPWWGAGVSACWSLPTTVLVLGDEPQRG